MGSVFVYADTYGVFGLKEVAADNAIFQTYIISLVRRKR